MIALLNGHRQKWPLSYGCSIPTWNLCHDALECRARCAPFVGELWNSLLSHLAAACNLEIVSRSDSESQPSSEECRVFNTTHWSVVLRATSSNGNDSAEALQQLCSTYWYP